VVAQNNQVAARRCCSRRDCGDPRGECLRTYLLPPLFGAMPDLHGREKFVSAWGKETRCVCFVGVSEATSLAFHFCLFVQAVFL